MRRREGAPNDYLEAPEVVSFRERGKFRMKRSSWGRRG